MKLKLSGDMRPYLLALQERFTKYDLIYTLRFKSKYSTRLYRLICSLHFHDLHPYTYQYTPEKLRVAIGAENYKAWQHFKDRALVPAITEINTYSDKLLDYEPIKRGRSFVVWSFISHPKTPWNVNDSGATSRRNSAQIR